MSLFDNLLGFKDDSDVWNLFVASVYAVLGILLLPFLLLVAIGTNYKGVSDRITNSPLGRVPGLSNGGWSAGTIVGVVALVIVYGSLGAIYQVIILRPQLTRK